MPYLPQNIICAKLLKIARFTKGYNKSPPFFSQIPEKFVTALKIFSLFILQPPLKLT